MILSICIFNIYSAGAQQSNEQKIVVYFDNNNFLISKSQSKRLDSLLSAYHFPVVSSIAGYTDSVGTMKDNLLLSHQRASTIDNYLKRNYRLNRTYTLNGFGKLACIRAPLLIAAGAEIADHLDAAVMH